jgi:HEAT repeat protein
MPTPAILLRWVAWSAVLTVALAVGLFALKLANGLRRRWAGVRHAHYLAGLGELLTRRLVPERVPRGWLRDPVFIEVVIDYARSVAGDEADTLEAIVARLGLRRQLARWLRRPFGHRRLKAAMVLGELPGPEVAELMFRHLTDRSSSVRLQVARGLATLGDPRLVDAILSEIDRETPWLAARYADVLVACGRRAVPAIASFLSAAGERRPAAAIQALRVLRAIGDTEAEPAIRPWLDSEDPEVRLAAASALATCGTPHSTPALIKAMADPTWQVRAQAAKSAADLGSPEATAPLARLLRDSAWWVRQNAAEALTTVPGGLSSLIAAISDPDRFAATAALYQLAVSGMIRSAWLRAGKGAASELDWALLERLVARVEAA